ncbi:MAG: hypothetical protein RMJ37_01635 [Spirochaetia bacterium]|nr:hypothetical protein [Spirochaetota bacterium]MCX8097102.1 hypothetical protein [Spirochaetota bacterium]MDW8112024.1 hypothetical protein [Spirochaetia bacterium]
MRLIVWFLVIIVFLFLGNICIAQVVSLITYGMEDGDVFVYWKSLNTNVSFSIYRSPIYISNSVMFSNNISLITKVGTYRYDELDRRGEFLYVKDPTPNIGANYYIVFVNKGGKDILEFVSEQNVSISFVIYTPLPKVELDYINDSRNVVIKWSRINGCDGYFVYKVDENFQGNLENLKPISVLSPDETILFDILPSDTNFSYIVIPFFKSVTNYYFSRKYNSVVVSRSRYDDMSSPKISTNLIVQRSSMDKALSVDANMNVTTNTVFITNYVTNFFTNEVKTFTTNLVLITNGSGRIPVSGKFDSSSVKSTLGYSSDSDFEGNLKYIVKNYFNVRNYSESSLRLRGLLENFDEDSYLKGLVMVYLARSEYALGRKKEAIDLLFKARRLIPEEADFWLSRFLVNK